MGFFSKLRCDECGKSSRIFINKFSDGYSEKLLCDDCLSKMHGYGFVEYQQKKGIKKVEYQKLCQYRYSYEAIINNQNYRYDLRNAKKLTTEQLELLVFELPGLRINKNFITITGFEDLIVETKDVFAITINPVIKITGPLVGYLSISFFTNNPLIPYFSTVIDGKVSVFSKKKKQFEQAISDSLMGYCRNLRYRIDSPDKIKSLVMQDANYSATINREGFVELLKEADLGIGYFNTDELYELSCKDKEWDKSLHAAMGYIFVK